MIIREASIVPIEKPAFVHIIYIHQRWKIADFGTTSEGTSKELSPSTERRGTAVYRGPELLGEEGGYNSKTDIWAFGCIAYEFCTKRKAFSGDWETLSYKLSAGSPRKAVFQFPPNFREGNAVKLAKAVCTHCVDETLELSWHARPSATRLLKVL